jgi:hypothetical protein
MKVPETIILLLIAITGIVVGTLTYEHFNSPTVTPARQWHGVSMPLPTPRPAAATMANMSDASRVAADHVQKSPITAEIPTRSANNDQLVDTNVVSKSVSVQHNDPKREQAAPIKKKIATATPCGSNHKPLHKHNHKKHKTTGYGHHHSGGHGHHHGGGGHHHHPSPGYSSGHYHPRC